MSTHILKTGADRDMAIGMIREVKLPCTLQLTRGQKRSVEQNRLQRMWINEAAEQLGDHTTEELRAYCKLHHGVPILRNENEEFREAYDRVIRPHSYEDKLTMMALPLDFPCTRLMTTEQKTRYLDAVYQDLTGRGVRLTEPERD